MASTFETDTRVTPGAKEGTFEGVIDPSWNVWSGPNGGYLAAMLHRAVRASATGAGPLRDLDVSFMEPASPGAATIVVEPVRQGRSVRVVQATLQQEESARVRLRATLGAARKGPAFTAREMPQVSGFSQGVGLEAAKGIEPPTFTQHCEYRLVEGARPLSGTTGEPMRVWMRLAQPAPYDEALVAFLADAWMAAVFAVLDEPVPAPSLEMGLQIARIPEALEAQDPLLGVFQAEHAGEGYVCEDGELWTADGELVARARQTRVLFA